MEAFVTHAELCAIWRTDNDLAADLRVAEITEKTVAQWRRRNFIPPWWWPEFVVALEGWNRCENVKNAERMLRNNT